MKLTYWCCTNLEDSRVYNIRERTRKAAQDRRAEEGVDYYSAPFKVEVEYSSGFDLMQQCMGEGGILGEYVR